MSRPKPRRRIATDPGPLAEFGRLLSDRRRRLGLTQLDLADLADVGVSSVHNLESGRRSPTLDVTLKVLDALGLTLACLSQGEAGTAAATVVALRSQSGADL
ncbi:helix-turn-helix domain-containing protein [Nocardia sp. NPDC055053]